MDRTSPPPQHLATPLPSLALDRHQASDVVEGAKREWLIANGHGDYGLGTACLLATRRYHGLLIAAARPPVARRVLVPFVDEEISGARVSMSLATRRWSDGSIDPDGHRHIASFALDEGIPTWMFECESQGSVVRLERRVVMLCEPRGVAVIWTVVDAPEPITLSARVFVEHRDHHHLDPDAQWTPAIAIDALHPSDACVELPINAQANSKCTLLIAGEHATLSVAGTWWRRHQLAQERARGYDFSSSAYHALNAVFTIAPGETRALVITIDEALAHAPDGATLLSQTRERHRALVACAGIAASSDALRWLMLAADAFVVARMRRDGSDGRTIIAGYPWFEDWGRDAMISLPGLLLCTGRAREAQSVLNTFAEHMRDGLLPNRFPDESEEPEYHSADAPLCFLVAACQTFDATNDVAWMRQLWPSMRAVIDGYMRGTRHGIGIDSDGLVRAGEVGRQLTWMDAKVGDAVITPRMGKPVELSAMWIDALRRMAVIAPTLAQANDAAELIAIAARAESSFARFWNPSTECLFDVLDGPDGDDASVRPNQLWALAAQNSPLPQEWRARALARVTKNLALPLAVRTLGPDAAGYRGRYEGDQRTRDGAYHMGTAWPFLTGLLLKAERLHAPELAAQHARKILTELETHLRDGGLGSLSEIVDGDAPHESRGCPMQAWSVGCLLEGLTAALDVRAATSETSVLGNNA
jgi:predicted glycogen debranching enzyme